MAAVSELELQRFADQTRSPVVAADGHTYHAATDASLMWPTNGRGEAPMVPLPGDRAPALSLALTASRDGWLHAVWDATWLAVEGAQLVSCC